MSPPHFMFQYMPSDALREMLQGEVKNDKLLHFFWQLLIEEPSPDTDERLQIFCELKPEFLHFHFHLHKNNTSVTYQGFPLLAVIQYFLLFKKKETECLNRVKLLIDLKANVDERFRDELTPVHLAAQLEAWEIVQLLIENSADLDIRINGETARKIIAKSRPDVVREIIVKYQDNLDSTLDEAFEALYDMDEARFIGLLHSNKNINVNKHNGRETLLQLAVRQGMVLAAEELVLMSADMNAMAALFLEPLLLAISNNTCLSVFIENRKLVNFRLTYFGGTILHALAHCIRKCPKNLKLLIQEAISQGVNIFAKNWKGLTAMEIITNDQSLENMELFNVFLDAIGLYIVDKNIIDVVSPEVFVKFLDEKINYQTSSSLLGVKNDQLDINFDFFDIPTCCSKNKAPEMLPLYEFSKSREHAKKVLLHPVIKLFLVHKWQKMVSVYAVNFFIYLIFTIFLSTHIYLIAAHNSSSNSTYSSNEIPTREIYAEPYIQIFCIIFWAILLLREAFQCKICYKYYFRNLENWLEIALLITSFLTFIPVCRINFILCISIFLAYFELTLLIGRQPSGKIYILMFLQFVCIILRPLLIFFPIIFAFAFTFFICFRNLAENENEFGNLWISVIRIFGMSVGEYDINEITFPSVGSEISIICFILLITLVLINLLNAVGVNKIESVIDEAETVACIANIKHYTIMESMFLGYHPDNCPVENRYRGFQAFRNNRGLLSFIRSSFNVNVIPFNDSEKIIKRNHLYFDIDKTGLQAKGNSDPKTCNLLKEIRFFYTCHFLTFSENKILEDILKNKRQPRTVSESEQIKHFIQRCFDEQECNMKSDNAKLEEFVNNAFKRCFNNQYSNLMHSEKALTEISNMRRELTNLKIVYTKLQDDVENIIRKT
jgi:hypothetical protein